MLNDSCSLLGFTMEQRILWLFNDIFVVCRRKDEIGFSAHVISVDSWGSLNDLFLFCLFYWSRLVQTSPTLLDN